MAWDEESLDNLIQEMRGKQIQADLIKLKELTEKHREYTLHGLHTLYKHVTNDMNKLVLFRLRQFIEAVFYNYHLNYKLNHYNLTKQSLKTDLIFEQMKNK